MVLLIGPGPISNETWAWNTELGVLDYGKHRTVEEMMDQVEAEIAERQTDS